MILQLEGWGNKRTDPMMLASISCESPKPRRNSVVVDWEATRALDTRPRARVSLYIMKAIICVLRQVCGIETDRERQRRTERDGER